jgi:hypothetical protein
MNPIISVLPYGRCFMDAAPASFASCFLQPDVCVFVAPPGCQRDNSPRSGRARRQAQLGHCASRTARWPRRSLWIRDQSVGRRSAACSSNRIGPGTRDENRKRGPSHSARRCKPSGICSPPCPMASCSTRSALLAEEVAMTIPTRCSGASSFCESPCGTSPPKPC